VNILRQYTQSNTPSTLRKSLSVLSLGLMLVVGGCSDGGDAKTGDSSSASSVQAQKASASKKTTEITEGQAFSHDAFDYAAGWKITHGEVTWNIDGLKAENTSSSPHYNAIQIKLWKAGAELVMLSCGSGKPVAPGASVSLDLCLSTDPLPPAYDKITINNF
jgi:hypothetical protein